MSYEQLATLYNAKENWLWALGCSPCCPLSPLSAALPITQTQHCIVSSAWMRQWSGKPTSLSYPSEGPAAQMRGWEWIGSNRPIGLSDPQSICVLIISGLNSSFGHTAAPEWSPLRRLTPSLKTPERGHCAPCLWSASYGEIISNS